jgi:DUF4097 and DUF4098 domain-containing protein YvlB
MTRLLPVTIRCFALTLTCAALAASAEVREETHKTFPLDASGEVSLQNVNGKIQIEAWDKNEVQLDAVKKAKTQEDLDAVTIEIKAEPARVAIATKHPNKGIWSRKGNSTSVDYTLKVPKSARLNEIGNVNGSIDIIGVRGAVEASTVNGSLSARELAADAKLSSVNGSVKVSFANMDAVKKVSFDSVNGSVELQLPANPNAELSLGTVNGSISGDVKPTKHLVGREVKTKLGDGTVKIKGNTVNGGMKVTFAKS